MHALYALDGMHQLSEQLLTTALNDAHPGVRRHAVRLVDWLLANGGAPSQAGPLGHELTQKLLAATRDNDSQVRYQLAFTLGELLTQGGPSQAGALSALAALARRDADNSWMRLAIQSSLRYHADNVFAENLGNEKFRRGPGWANIPIELGPPSRLGCQPTADGKGNAELARIFDLLNRLPKEDEALRMAGVQAAVEGLARQGRSLRDVLPADASAGVSKILDRLLTDARKNASDEKLPIKQRVEALDSLVLGSFSDSRELLVKLLDQRQPPEIQLAALTALGRFTGPIDWPDAA